MSETTQNSLGGVVRVDGIFPKRIVFVIFSCGLFFKMLGLDFSGKHFCRLHKGKHDPCKQMHFSDIFGRNSIMAMLLSKKKNLTYCFIDQLRQLRETS